MSEQEHQGDTLLSETIETARREQVAAGMHAEADEFEYQPGTNAFLEWVTRDSEAALALDDEAMGRIETVQRRDGLEACAEQIMREHALKVMPEEILDIWLNRWSVEEANRMGPGQIRGRTVTLDEVVPLPEGEQE